MIKHVGVAIITFVFALLTTLGLYTTPLRAASPPPDFKFWGKKDITIVNDSARYAWVRLAVYVRYYDNTPDAVTPYVALHCFAKDSAGNKSEYPCSISLRLQLYDCSGSCTIKQNFAKGTSNSGSDGFWSDYGDGFYGISRCRHFYRTEIDIIDFGLRGVHYDNLPNQISNPYTPVQACPA